MSIPLLAGPLTPEPSEPLEIMEPTPTRPGIFFLDTKIQPSYTEAEEKLNLSSDHP